MIRRLSRNSVVLTLCFLLLISIGAVSAQSLAEPGASTALNESSLIDDLVTRAEQSGASIIVINPSSNGENNGRNALNEIASEDHGDSSVEFTAFMSIQSSALVFRDRLKAKLSALPYSYQLAVSTIKSKSPSNDLDGFSRIFYWSIALLLFGILIEYLLYTKFVVNRFLKSRLKENPQGYTEKLPVLISRAILRFGGVILSMIVAYTLGSYLFANAVITPPVQFTIAVIYLGYALCRIVAITWRIILVPYLSQYRIPQFNNSDALSLFYWLTIGAIINIIADLSSIWITEVAQNGEIDAALMSVSGLFITLYNTAMVVTNRRSISRALRNGKSLEATSGLMRFISRLWVPVSILYFLFSWLEISYRLVMDLTLSTPLIAGAYGILISIIIVYGLINYVIERFFQRERALAKNATTDDMDIDPVSSSIEQNDDVAQEVMEVESHDVDSRYVLNSYEDLSRRVAGILSVMAGFWALTSIWDLNSNSFYNGIVTRGLDVLFILFIGYIVYQIVRIWIDNKIHEEGADEIAVAPGDEGGASGSSRIATLLPLFRNFMLVVVAVSVLFSVLLELGINVSPLFAGAGVVGLAIGFGSQALVKDIFSGAFFLFDDAFRKGEYVDIGEVKGTVENISVRSFQLRHHLGPLHTIPFGEIQHLTNFSRDWVMMKLPLRLTYDTDPEKVRKLIKKLGQQLADDPEIGENFLQPLKSQGVIEMQDSAMIVRVKFMTRPGDQWTIRKRVFQEIRDLFYREGIKFAHREVTVRLAGDDVEGISDADKKAIAAAALGDDEEMAGNSGKTGGDDR